MYKRQYVLREKTEDGKITSTTYYTIEITEKTDAGVGSDEEEKNPYILSLIDTVTVSCETVETIYSEDGKSFVDFSSTNGILLMSLTVKDEKTEKETRILINRELQETLLSYRKTQTSIADTDYLFPSPRKADSPLSRYQAYRIVRKAAEAVGIEDVIRCHSLRKTFGYHAWKMGTPPALLMEIYNHSSFQITKHYLGIEQDDKDAVFRDIQL
mgnify:FL=1